MFFEWYSDSNESSICVNIINTKVGFFLSNKLVAILLTNIITKALFFVNSLKYPTNILEIHWILVIS